MNTLIFFAFLIADISAYMTPETDSNMDITRDERLANKIFYDTIDSMSQNIKDAGLDPASIKYKNFDLALPVPSIFKLNTSIEDFISIGLSNIVIKKVNLSVINSRMNFEIEMPRIYFSVGAAAFKATVFNNTLDIKTSGDIEIKNTRIAGQIRFSVGISGVNIRTVKVTFTLGDIIPNIMLFVQNTDFSSNANRFVGTTVPQTIKDFRLEINELFEIIILGIFKESL